MRMTGPDPVKELITRTMLAFCLVLSATLMGIGNLIAANSSDSAVPDARNTHYRRDVIVLPDTILNGVKFIRRAVILCESREAIWRVLVDPQEAKGFMPKLKQFQVLQDFVDSQIVLCKGKPSWLLKTFSCKLKLRFESGRRIFWERIEGDFDRLDGSWELVRLDDVNTLAIYSVHCEPGTVIPQFVIDCGIKRDLPKMLHSLAERLAQPDNRRHDGT